jgi:hypothetical protein
MRVRKPVPAVTKLPLLVLLLGLSAIAQVPATTMKSGAVFSHGVPLALVQDAGHGVNVVSRVRSAIRKRYVQVFVGVRNTGAAANLELNSGGMILLDGKGGFYPAMDAAEVQEMTKEASHHQILGAIGLTPHPEFGDSATTASGPNLQGYKQSPAEEMYDGAYEDDASNPTTFLRTRLSRASLTPGNKAEGFVYFDLGKNGADPDAFKSYQLKIPLGDQVYEMDYAPSARAATAPPPAASAAPKPQTPAAPAAPTAIGNSSLQVISDPDEVDVALDGQFVGQTPLLIPLPAGDHTVRLTKNGYATFEQKIHATGVRVTIDTTLKKSMIYRAH